MLELLESSFHDILYPLFILKLFWVEFIFAFDKITYGPDRQRFFNYPCP